MWRAQGHDERDLLVGIDGTDTSRPLGQARGLANACDRACALPGQTGAKAAARTAPDPDTEAPEK